MGYPLHIPVAPTVLAAWHGDEEASYEDADGAAGHVYELLGRHRSALVLRSGDEVEAVLASGDHHGDVTGWDDRFAYRRAVARACARLRRALEGDGGTPGGGERDDG